MTRCHVGTNRGFPGFPILSLSRVGLSTPLWYDGRIFGSNSQNNAPSSDCGNSAVYPRCYVTEKKGDEFELALRYTVCCFDLIFWGKLFLTDFIFLLNKNGIHFVKIFSKHLILKKPSFIEYIFMDTTYNTIYSSISDT